ncbi:MAG: SDR family oxidoreductase [Treponema sp.]|nr:SDR family oxidoreductase [Treponema sp.]
MGIFSGKTAVVIGGSGGIGRAVSKKLALAGASLTVHGGHDSKDFDFFIEELNSISKKNSPESKAVKSVFQLNLKNYRDIFTVQLKKIVESADIVCVCFGPFIQKSFVETSLEDWETMALMDYALPGFCISSALPYMIKKNWGRFLLFGGTRTFGINGFKTNPAYGGAKTGVCSLVRSVAMEYTGFGITCNAVLPGFTETEYLSEKTKEVLRKKMPSGSLISPETIADGGMYLLQSPEINGVLLNIDGGWDGRVQSS